MMLSFLRRGHSDTDMYRAETMWRHGEKLGCSIAQSFPTHCNPMDGLQHARLHCPSLSPQVCSNSCPLSRWCHPTISASAIFFSSSPKSFPASESFPVSWLFALSGQSTGASASTSGLPIDIQGWFPSGLTGLISLLSRRLSRVSSSITVWKHQFLSTQLPGHLQTKESGLEKILLLQPSEGINSAETLMLDF